MTQSNFHTEDPQILGTTVKKLVITVTWCLEFIHPCHSKSEEPMKGINIHNVTLEGAQLQQYIKLRTAFHLQAL
jgi:hypothetical protein